MWLVLTPIALVVPAVNAILVLMVIIHRGIHALPVWPIVNPALQLQLAVSVVLPLVIFLVHVSLWEADLVQYLLQMVQ